MTGVGERQQHIIEQTETTVVAIGHEMPHRLIDIFLVIERIDLVFLAFLLMRMLFVYLLVIGTHILLLDKSGVR